MKTKDMYEALVNDPVKNPERTGTTFERVCEVIQNVLPEDDGEDVVAQIKTSLGNISPRKALSEEDAYKLIDELDRFEISAADMREIVNQLLLCELSTDEVLELHQTYKIPVSELETDILPVQGDGCWIMDSKGKWYLDLDSNYSATNLGMSNSRIAQGLYNQAKRSSL